MSAEKIHVEEDAPAGSQDETRDWTEELKVSGRELLATVKSLFHEANVRRIVIRNTDRRILLEIPIVLGVAGIALASTWAAVGLIAALVADCSIVVERADDAAQPAE